MKLNDILKKLNDLKLEKAELDAQSKLIKTKIDKINSVLKEKLDKEEREAVATEDYGFKIITVNRNIIDSKKLQEENPEIYDKYVRTNVSYRFNLSKIGE